MRKNARSHRSGIYKEWWANPAVVGLMGFATTTMATGLHNVGYWGAGQLWLWPSPSAAPRSSSPESSTFEKAALSAAPLSCRTAPSGGPYSVAVHPGRRLASCRPSEELGFFLMWTLFTIRFCVAVQGVGKFLAVLFWLLCWLSFCWTSSSSASVPHPWLDGRSLSLDWLPGTLPWRRWRIRSTKGRFSALVES